MIFSVAEPSSLRYECYMSFVAREREKERNIADNAIVVAFAEMKGLYSKNDEKKKEPSSTATDR